MLDEERNGTAPTVRAETAPTVLVDDDPHVREVLRIALRRYGFEVWVADDGRDAIEAYRELLLLGRNPAVLLDVQMPGQDGPVVLGAVQTFNADVRAYFMTGDPSPYTVDELLALGAKRVFAKPLNFSSVAAELRRGFQTAGQNCRPHGETRRDSCPSAVPDAVTVPRG